MNKVSTGGTTTRATPARLHAGLASDSLANQEHRVEWGSPTGLGLLWGRRLLVVWWSGCLPLARRAIAVFHDGGPLGQATRSTAL